jgi:serine/threonine protein kinase
VTDADERAALEAFVGRTLQGRYRIDALLGMGGMGAVFRAHHLGLQQDVALKVLRPGLRSGHIAPARFEREARSASRLDHPNCVRVNDFGELDDGTKFLVMELLAGDELESRLGAPWDPVEAIDVAVQILDGLAHAHARGVVHRDLKPANVLLTADHHGQRRVKLVDFGIAKLLEGDDAGPKLTRTGMLFGTPRYMSPEQAGGGKVDARTDLYAVGLLLYEMLAGHPPFQAGDVSAIIRMHVLVPPPPLPESVPPGLAAVVMRLLAKSRADRFANAAETIAALDRVRAELVGADSSSAMPTSASAWQAPASELWPTITSYGPQVSTRRRFTRGQLLAAAMVLALSWIGVVVLVWIWSSPPTPTSVPESGAPAPRVAEAKPRSGPPAPTLVPSRLPSCRGDDCECEGPDVCDLECTDDCELECEGARACRFACSDDCEVECGGQSECTVEVGHGSKIECAGKSHCAVTCRGDCELECHGRAGCELRCLDDSEPLDCGKHTHACGRCR